jgi:cytosine/adenosine deaminase-related metal-dependent hydrolase
MKLLIREATLVTVNAQDEVLPSADLAVADGEIVAVGSAPEGFAPDRILDGHDRIVLPGPMAIRL